MAQPFNNAVMPNCGIKLLNDAQAGECTIEFTRIAIGNGEYTEEEKERSELIKATGLKSEKKSYKINSKKKVNDNSIVLTCNITNYDESSKKALITEGFYINEIAVYAKAAGTENEILYSIAVTSGNTGDYMPPYNGYNPASIIQSYVVSVNNASDVKVSVDLGVYALQKDLEECQNELEKIKESTVNIATALMDTDAVTKAFKNVFSHIRGGGESGQAMDEEDVLKAINTTWTGESSENPNALSASDVTDAISKEWTGESSDNPNALSAEEIYQAIANAGKV